MQNSAKCILGCSDFDPFFEKIENADKEMDAHI
jgi:hypothetical protein